MSKLQKILDEFRSDTHWNTENKDGTHRFDSLILWIEKMVKEYAETLGLSEDEVMELMEEKRNYSWPNYYQEANFPPLDSNSVVGVFQTFEEFNEYSKTNYTGFKCGVCGDIGDHPQECEHRILKDGKCDWTSYGFFKSGTTVIILESGIKAIPIFEPVLKEQ